MATHHGKAVVVRLGTAPGSNVVAEVSEFSLETSAEIIDDTVMGDTWKTHLVGFKEFSGSLTCFWDETDTNGQEAMDEGASVTINLLPEGIASTAAYWWGVATITRMTLNASKDGVVTRGFDFQGNGALTQTTVA